MDAVWESLICRAIAILVLWFPLVALADDKADLVYFGADDDAALLGLGQGLEDADPLGLTFQPKYQLRILAQPSVRPINDPKPAAIFATADAESLRLLSELNPGVPVFNLIDDYEDLRALCLPNLLHIMPSAQMREDAIRQWREKHPRAKPEAIAWHESLERNGAARLNERFKEERQQSMSEQAWTGWAAARIFTIAQARTDDSEDLLDYLKTELKFDGRKGAKMSFRPNGQLRQPLLLVEDDTILGLAPVRPHDLDSLGFRHCPSSRQR